MAGQLFKEQFDGPYNGVLPKTLMPVGSISDGLNMRRAGAKGGWKVRKGCTLFNTTALETPSSVKSLHQYTHPRNADYHFIAQCNSKLLDAPSDPPTAAAGSAWTTLESSNVGATPGFSDVVREHWFYADGTSRPIVWGGDNPYCSGFLYYDVSELAYVDFTREVTDNRSTTYASFTIAAGDFLYICSPEIAEEITITMGSSVNNNEVLLTELDSWVAGAWADRGETDGTVTGAATLTKSGSITWNRNATDTMRVLAGIMGYWYKISFAGALDAVTITSVKVKFDATPLTNKWDGIPQAVAGCLFYDHSGTEYQEALGKVSSGSTSQYIDISEAQTDDFLYAKTNEPATGFGIGIVVGYGNTSAGNIDNIEHWDGDSWAAGAGIIDETLDGAGDSSLNQTGWVWFNAAAITAVKRTFQGDPIAGYWYRISWDAALSTDVRVYLVSYAPYPEVLPAYDGCIQFKNRLLVWGDPEFPNRLRYSAKDKPDCFSGADSGYTDALGNMTKVTAAVRFYNELVCFKRDSVWLLEGDDPTNFGKLQITDTVGLASPKTALAVEVGYPGVHKLEPMSIITWQDVDGVYVLDGRKPVKISGAVDQYFNPEYSACITAATITTLQAFADRVNNEYHLVLPAAELVYNYLHEEWYPPWDRSLDLVCGLSFKGADYRFYTYGATAGGFVCQLENDTTDKSAANADVAISHSITTRAISAVQDQATTFHFLLRHVWVEAKARTAGAITTTFYKDLATSGTALAVPEAMSLINTGFSLATPKLDISQNRCACMELKFAVTTADVELEIYSMLYLIEAKGLNIA